MSMLSKSKAKHCHHKCLSPPQRGHGCFQLSPGLCFGDCQCMIQGLDIHKSGGCFLSSDWTVIDSICFSGSYFSTHSPVILEFNICRAEAEKNGMGWPIVLGLLTSMLPMSGEGELLTSCVRCDRQSSWVEWECGVQVWSLSFGAFFRALCI